MGIPAGAKVSQAELPKSNKKKQGAWGIPGCPVVKTPPFRCSGHRLDPWSGKFPEKKKEKETRGL